MRVDGWHIPEPWARGIDDAAVRYTGAIRVWPVGDSGFAVAAHHVQETSMCAYFGEFGVMCSREPPQQTWDLAHLGAMAHRVRSLRVEDGHLAFINAGFRGQENPFLVVHVPTMRLSAIRFVRGWTYAPMQREGGSIVFLHDPSTGELAPGASPTVRVRIADLEWTEYAARPQSHPAADAWFLRHASPRDVGLVGRIHDRIQRRAPGSRHAAHLGDLRVPTSWLRAARVALRLVPLIGRLRRP